MERNNTPTLLVPLLALLAILFPFASVVRSPSAPAEETPQTKQSTIHKRDGKSRRGLPRYGAASLIEDFLHARHERKRGWARRDPRSQYCLHFMIATVPDPVDSRLPYFFDSFLDSIQRAFEAGGYVLDRYRLAWSEPPPKTEETKEAKQPENTPRYRWEPSLLLFRNTATDTDSPDNKLFLVFVVGETPTNGLQKAAMDNALRQLGNFFPWGPGYKALPKELHKLKLASSEIKIMGPAFSGSAISLDFVLRDWLARIRGRAKRFGEPLPTFRIVSGTATAIDPEDFTMIGPGDTFHAMVPPDKETIQPILRYIRSLGKTGRSSMGYTRIAMLTETNTAYGRQDLSKSLGEDRNKGKDKNKDEDTSKYEDKAKSKDKGRDNDTDVSVINLPFPLHISQLRTISGKQRLAQQQLESNPSGVHVHAHILSAEVQSAPPTTAPPSFSDLDAPSAEMVLSRLLSTISHEGYHAVGIMATDVRDTMFLASEIHRHCPGTLVFTVNADLLYTHPDVRTSMLGMLVFTPYPLFSLDQVWTRPFLGKESRLQFPSQAAEGVYNATLELLGEEYELEEQQEKKTGQEKDVDPRKAILDYGAPFRPDELEGLKDPPQGKLAGGEPAKKEPAGEIPALWVTAMGRNGPLPVKLLPWTDSDHYAISVKRDPQESRATIGQEGIYTATSALGMALFGVVIFIFSWMAIRQYRSPRNLVRASWLFREPVTREYRPQARLFLLVGLVSLLSPYLLVNVVYFLPTIASLKLGIFSSKWWQSFIAIALAAGLLSLVAAIIVIVRAFRKGPRQNTLLRGKVRKVILFGCLVFLLSLALAIVWLWTALRAPAEAIFTYVRAFAFTSGLSPLLPLFCVALAGVLWAFGSFRRLRTIDGMRARGSNKRRKNCLLSANTPSLEGVITLGTNVQDLLEKALVVPSKSYTRLIVAVLILAMYLYFFFLPFVPSYDGARFYFLFGWGSLLMYEALTMEFGRLFLAWRALRRLLQRLALHPMQAAYGRYRKNFPGLPRIDLAGPLQTYAVLSHSVDQAERLLRLASSEVWSPTLRRTERRALQRWIQGSMSNTQGAARNLSEALKYDADGKWRLAIKKRSRCQQALGQLTRLMAQILEPTWRTRKIAAPPDKESPTFQTFRQLGEEFLAGRTVLLLSYVLPALRNLGALILAGLLLMLFSVLSYPFLERNRILAFNWIVILAFVGLAVTVMFQMERDAVISALNGTKPGQVTVTRQFTFHFLTYVMIPILALLGAQFPDTVGRILSWFSSTPGH